MSSPCTKLCCFLGLVALLFLQPCTAAQLRPDDKNPCIASFNSSVYDISKVFDYPINITDDARGYYYLFDPCGGYNCPDQINSIGDSCAVCQKADFFYNCGVKKEPIWFLEQFEPPVFKIQYPWGIDWRISIFTFMVEDSQEIPTVTFMGEQPLLQYNFLVTGRCLGQPYGSDCKGKSGDSKEQRS